MNNYVISLIRTYVPIGVGAVASWLLVHFAFSISAGTQVGITALLTALLSAGYYAGARALEQKYPQLGVLLGHPAQPSYKPVVQVIPGPILPAEPVVPPNTGTVIPNAPSTSTTNVTARQSKPAGPPALPEATA